MGYPQHKRFGLAVLSLIATVLPAQADVTVQESMSVNGGGLMGFANMSGKTTTQISGTRSRIETDVQMQSRLVRAFAGGPTAEITQLDSDKVYELNLKKKQYTATSLAERRAQMEQALKKGEEAQQSKQEAASPVDQSKCDWSPPKSEVKKTGEKASIAGFDAERLTITVTQSCKNRETGEVCDFGLALDQWLAPKFDGGSERQAFYQAYAEKMGFSTSAAPGFAQNAQAMFAGYKDLWAELAKQSGSQKGYPVRSAFSLAIGGAQCSSQQKQTAAGAPAQEAMAAASELGAALGGMFGGKKKAAAAEPAPTAPALLVNGMPPLMTVSTELLSLSRDALAPALFEPPADFKRVDKN
ncbi:hypothetical protein [Nevskia sp.]|uniref:hypothetical protein n=1 Tax=Nevskia sp. TaxID=1929292 RepID=UPI0025E2BDC0|nr:hypothetical protein [Nevskia sp.]